MFIENVYAKKPLFKGFFYAINNKHSFSRLFIFYQGNLNARKGNNHEFKNYKCNPWFC